MDCIILAAGMGTRLGDIGKKTPKILLEASGRRVVDIHLEKLAKAGVTRFFFNVFHQSEQIIEYLEKYKSKYEIVIKVEKKLSGTAGAIKLFKDELNENFLILYGDVVGNYRFQPLIEKLNQNNSKEVLGVIYLVKSENVFGKGVVVLDEQNNILKFIEKPKSLPLNVDYYINAGIYFLNKKIFDFIDQSDQLIDFGKDVFPLAIKSNARLIGMKIKDDLFDIGTLDILEKIDAIRHD
jgi:NDP-sugar pyrophosphorylase family protein